MLIQSLIDSSKYNLKCPYEMNPIGICIHNTYNDASAKNEISYMKSNSSSTSFHIAVDAIESIQAIPFNRNAWHAGDGGSGNGNRKYISIEICYSKSGGDKFNKAEQRASKEVASLLKSYGWGIDKVKKHQDFSGKYCPHRTLDLGWNRFLNMIKTELDGTTSSTTTNTNTAPTNNSVSTLGEAKNYIGSRCKELQEKLIACGYNCGGYGADGIFGNSTYKSLIDFQSKNGLVADGLAGTKTFNKLDELIAVKNSRYTVKITASVLNVRVGPGTSYAVFTSVKQNEVYTIVEEKNGWGKLKSGAGWISLSYAKKM